MYQWDNESDSENGYNELLQQDFITNTDNSSCSLGAFNKIARRKAIKIAGEYEKKFEYGRKNKKKPKRIK